MPAVARIGDPFATGHGCTGTSTIAEGSDTVFAEGIGVSRTGDMSVAHAFPLGGICVPHVVPISGGSATVFADGRPLARVTDAIDSGQIVDGADAVFAG